MNIWKPVAIYCIGYIAGGNKIKKEYQKYTYGYSTERRRRTYDRQYDGTRSKATNELSEALKYSLSEGIKKFTNDILFGDSNVFDRHGRNNSDAHVDVLLFETFGEARDILHKMKMQILDKGYVTVADYYSYCGLSCTYEDREWCWTSLSGAYVTRFTTNGEFTINFGAKTIMTNPMIQHSNNSYSEENSDDEDCIETVSMDTLTERKITRNEDEET